MRLLSLHVRNYRIHTDQTIEFDPERTVIGGPNESGKSTLAEAAHRALFTNHRWGGKILEGMRSRDRNEPPEVTLRFHAGGNEYTLTKVFAGTSKGRAELRDEHQNQWTGNEAEEKLAELLGNDGPASKKDADTQWAHLWIRQGNSGEDPSTAATREKDSLTARLQQEGGTAVLQSDQDSRVANQFIEQAEGLFNQNGTPKTQSPMAHAERARNEARMHCEQAQARSAQLEQAVEDYRSAQQRLSQTSAALPELEKQQDDTRRKLAEAIALEEQEEAFGKALKDVEQRHKSLKEIDQRIRTLDETIARSSRDIEPAEEANQRLTEQIKKLEGERQHAATTADEASAQLRTARASFDAAQVHRQRLECLAGQKKLDRRLAEATKIEAEIQEARKQLAQMPGMTADSLDQLRRLISKHDQDKASLEAIATGVELIEGTGAAELDQTPLETGKPRIISALGKLVIAGTTLHIHPGGGRNLEELQDALKTSGQALADAFNAIGTPTFEDATQLLAKRNGLETNIASLTQKHLSLEPAEAKEESERLAARRIEIESQLERLSGSPGAPTSATDTAEVAALEARARTVMEAASKAEQDAVGTRNGLETKLRSLRNDLQTSAEHLKTGRQALAEAKIRQQTLVEEHGSAPERAAHLAELDQKSAASRQQFEKIHQKLKALQPEQLKSDDARLARSIRQQADAQASARESLAAARATLRSDGSSDPHSDLTEARQRLESAEEALQAATRRAKATQHLAELFREERQRLADRFTAPLSAKVGDYLRCVFGSDAIAGLKLEDGAFGKLQIGRPDGQFDFSVLSGGTREQVAAAMRLAVAELLATDHDGCLPIVFDDSFTHSDPDRVLKLQRMLDLAATRGLQIIVLTCTPDDYRSLGATETLLTNRSRRPPHMS